MRHKSPPKRRSFKKITAYPRCKGCSDLAAVSCRSVELLAISAIATGIRRSRLCEKTFHFVVVSLEWVAHDEKIAAVACDRIPVDNIREVAGLKKRDCTRATGCARISRRNLRRARTPHAVVPLRDSFARRDTKEQSAARIDVVIFEIDTLQPWVVPAQCLGFDKCFQQPFLGDPVNAANQRLAIMWDCFKDESPVFQ